MEINGNITKKTNPVNSTIIVSPVNATREHQTAKCAAPKSQNLADFLDEARCRLAVLEILHPRGAHCPQCDYHIIHVPTLRNFWAGRRCVCRCCGCWFSARTNTILQGSQLSFAQIFLIVFFTDTLGIDIPVSIMAAAIGVSYDTARTWIKRIKAF